MTAESSGPDPGETAPAAPAGGAVSYRLVNAGDEELLYRIYASTRAEELAPVPWSAEQKEAFLRMQFLAQSRDYAGHFPQGDFRLVLVDGMPAGRLYLDHGKDRLLIVDIALLPEYRGGGIGGGILRGLLADATAGGKPVEIHVERMNPALRLYERLGFRPVADHGIYLLMRWSASGDGIEDSAASTVR